MEYTTVDGQTIRRLEDLQLRYPEGQSRDTPVEHRYYNECYQMMLCELVFQNLPSWGFKDRSAVALWRDQSETANDDSPRYSVELLIDIALFIDIPQADDGMPFYPERMDSTVSTLRHIEDFARIYAHDYLQKKAAEKRETIGPPPSTKGDDGLGKLEARMLNGKLASIAENFLDDFGGREVK